MNEAKHHDAQAQSDAVSLPAFPIPGTRIFEKIVAAVSAVRGYPLTNAQIARLIGQYPSTLSYYLGRASHHHVISLFCLLEQLSRPERYRVIDALCRELPSFDHPRLAHSPTTVGFLNQLVAKAAGLTLIRGSTAENRTFLINALGHAFIRNDRTHRGPIGMDTHEPSWFVPIESVSYIKCPFRKSRLPEIIRKVWSQVRTGNSPLMLLNGIWSIVPELQREFTSLAAARHVIIADEIFGTAGGMARLPQKPDCVLTVSITREALGGLAIQIESQD